MYCRKCGKKIDYDAPVCKECEAEETNDLFGEFTVASSEKQEDNYSYGESAFVESEKRKNETYSEPFIAPEPQIERDKKEGFGKALTATIMGCIGVFISFIVLCVMLALVEEFSVAYEEWESSYGSSYAYSDEVLVAGGVATLVVSIFFTLVSLGLAIPSLILGIKSIKCFSRARKEGRVKPIATLVLGIVGVVSSAITLLYVLLNYILSLSVIMYI